MKLAGPLFLLAMLSASSSCVKKQPAAAAQRTLATPTQTSLRGGLIEPIPAQSAPAPTTAAEAATRWLGALSWIQGERLEALTAWPFQYSIARHGHVVGRLKPGAWRFGGSHTECATTVKDGRALADWLNCARRKDTTVIAALRQAWAGKRVLPDDLDPPRKTVTFRTESRDGKPFSWVSDSYDLSSGADRQTVGIDVGVEGTSAGGFHVRALRVRVDFTYDQAWIDRQEEDERDRRAHEDQIE